MVGLSDNVRELTSHEGAIHMTAHPYISAALADERRKTLLAQAEAAGLANQARSHRQQKYAAAGRTSLIRWFKLVAVGHI
jgi:hypothetical protein